LLVDDLDVALVEPFGERIEERSRHLHAAALGQADVALALLVAVADGDVALAAGVLREERLEPRRVGLAVARETQHARVGGAQLFAIRVERMAAQVETEALLLVAQALALRPWRGARELERVRRTARAPEEIRLLGEVRLALGEVDRAADRGEEARAIRLDLVEGPRL